MRLDDLNARQLYEVHLSELRYPHRTEADQGSTVRELTDVMGLIETLRAGQVLVVARLMTSSQLDPDAVGSEPVVGANLEYALREPAKVASLFLSDLTRESRVAGLLSTEDTRVSLPDLDPADQSFALALSWLAEMQVSKHADRVPIGAVLTSDILRDERPTARLVATIGEILGRFVAAAELRPDSAPENVGQRGTSELVGMLSQALGRDVGDRWVAQFVNHGAGRIRLLGGGSAWKAEEFERSVVATLASVASIDPVRDEANVGIDATLENEGRTILVGVKQLGPKPAFPLIRGIVMQLATAVEAVPSASGVLVVTDGASDAFRAELAANLATAFGHLSTEVVDWSSGDEEHKLRAALVSIGDESWVT